MTSTDIVARRRFKSSCIHGQPAFCARCVTRRRRISHLLDELVGRPPVLVRPSTFGLGPDELCAEARRLRRAGLPPGEVLAILANVDRACLELAS